MQQRSIGIHPIENTASLVISVASLLMRLTLINLFQYQCLAKLQVGFYRCLKIVCSFVDKIAIVYLPTNFLLFFSSLVLLNLFLNNYSLFIIAILFPSTSTTIAIVVQESSQKNKIKYDPKCSILLTSKVQISFLSKFI